MKLLLDTQIFLWYIGGDPKLSGTFREAIRDPDSEVFLSAASVWEAVIKYSLDKLPLPEPPDTFLPQQREAHEILALPVDEGAFTYLAKLPSLHKDPFDRLLIAQTLQHGMTLLTVDEKMMAYDVPRMTIR